MAIPSIDSSAYMFTETRLSSQLSRTYNFISPDSQIGMPFMASPIILHLPAEPSSNTPTHPLPTTPTETEGMAPETVTPFHGDKEDESPEDFLWAFYRRIGNKIEDSRKNQFWYYLQANSVADEWFTDLDDEEKKMWKDIEIAFEKRWPQKKQVKKTEEEYKDEIVRRKLKAEDLGKKEIVVGRETYTHIAWADKMEMSVKGAKWEKTTNQLWQVRKSLPNILREKVGTGHADWEAFLQDVRDVDIEYI